jgi:glycine cleavage system regulatory protein
MTPLALTFIGRDRPGLVKAISEKIAAAGGTWLESRLAHLAGEFAGILLVGVPETNVDAFAEAMRDLESAGLRVTVARSEAAPAPPTGKLLALNVLGHERPGIVRDVTQTLTEFGVNIEEFESRVEAAPFTGAEMFHAAARIRLPDGVAPDALRKRLEKLAGEIMVDLALEEGETEG